MSSASPPTSAPPQATLDLWARVGAGLTKTRVVAWRDGALSLQAARKFFAGEAAREFARQHAGANVGIFLEQRPRNIGTSERVCVQRALEVAVELVVMDLKRISERGGTGASALVDSVLCQAFNKKKAYFKAAGGMGNPRGMGLPAVRLKCIESFRTLGGFRELSIYLANNVDNESAISLATMQQVLGALNDTGFSASSNLSVKQKEGRAQECRVVAKDIMVAVNLRAHSESGIKPDQLEQLDVTLQDLCRMYDNISNTHPEDALEFYANWQELCLCLVGSSLPPVQVSGWEQLAKLVKVAEESRPPPLRQKKWWFLSEPDSERPGTDRDIDHYQHKCENGPEEEALPPAAGWITCRGSSDPPPHLQAQGLVVPEGEEEDTLEHRLADWAVKSKLVGKLLGKGTS
ncbi:hypothetical protein ACHAWF_009605 [Thalassiosira exigua]